MGNEGYIYKWATTLWTYLMLYLLGAWYTVKELLVPHRTPTGIRCSDQMMTKANLGLMEIMISFYQRLLLILIIAHDIHTLLQESN